MKDYLAASLDFTKFAKVAPAKIMHYTVYKLLEVTLMAVDIIQIHDSPCMFHYSCNDDSQHRLLYNTQCLMRS